jgi:excinuclease ABC subunit A
MAATDIVIKGAREHNLRDVELALPRNRLICFTGVSGSGKSSLAFDTLYAEGQRRYVESLSSFARQFLGQMPKPDVDLISGLSPSISISQKTAGMNPRSTVGTITEIYDYLRVLYARVGKGHCPQCGRAITAQTRQEILGRISSLPPGTQFLVLAPMIRGQKGEYRDLFVDLLKQGFVRARVDGSVVRLTDELRLDRQMRHNIEVVVDRLTAGPTSHARLAEAVELALKIGEGNLIVACESDGQAQGAAGELPGPGSLKRAGVAARANREAGRSAAGGNREAGRSAAGGNRETGRKAAGGADAAQTQRSVRRSARKARAEAEGEGLPAETSPGGKAGFAEDIHLSAHYACTHCGLSFEPPSPQLFSFNSPQGMCLSCNGLGEIYGFVPELLVANPSKSFQQGAIELLGAWKEMGRWRRHIYRGVAEALERTYGLETGTVLETAWEELPAEVRQKLLWGTGDEHITFTWRSGPSGYKWGGKFEGIIPKLLAQYHGSRNRMQRRMLEKYMSVVGCTACGGQRLNPQARAVTLTSRSPQFAEKPQRTLPGVCGLAVTEAEEFFRELELDATGQLIAVEAIKEIRGRLTFLKNVGLDYLSLGRTAPTLSGGEMQRIRLAGQIGCGLVGVLYILDEPSVGLHPRDNDRLLETLAQLRDQGNTVVVVEHDEDTIAGGGLRGRFRARPRRPRWPRGGLRPGRRDRPASGEHHRAVSLGRSQDRDPRAAASGGSEKTGDPRGHAQQSQEHRRRDPVGGLRLRDRRFGLRQELAGQRHPGRGPAAGPQRRPGQPRRPPRDRGPGAPRQADRHRPVAHRPHAPLQPGHLHQALRRNPRPLHATARVESPGLQAGPLQLQCQERPLRGLRGQRLDAPGDGLLGRRLGHLPGL